MKWWIALAAAVLGGCIVIPNLSDEPFEQEESTFVVGVTTKSEVREVLGEPLYESEGELFYYDSDWRWLGIAFVSGVDPVSDEKAYYFVLRFDQSDRLIEFERSSGPWDPSRGPYKRTRIPLAQAFSVQLEELELVSEAKAICPPNPPRVGIFVQTPHFIGFAHWEDEHYEVLWKIDYSSVDIIRLDKCRIGGCEISTQPHDASALPLSCCVWFYKESKSDRTRREKVEELREKLGALYN